MSTEKFRTREQILSSKHWSGEDTGRAYLYSLIAPLEDKPQIPDERLLEGLRSLVGNDEQKAYDEYKALYQFLTFENGQMQALEYAVKAEIAELRSYIMTAGTAEFIYTSLITDSIKVKPAEFAKIAERTVQNITGESGYEPRYFDIDDIVDLLVYQSTMKDGLVLTPDGYNSARELLGSGIPEIKTKPPKADMLMFNQESSILCDVIDYADVDLNPQIDRLRDMTKAQRAALRDSLCKRLSNSTNYAEYKARPTMNSKFTEFREDMWRQFPGLKISGLTLYYFGFSCFFLLARHSDTIFYDCKRKHNGIAITPNLDASLALESRPNVEYRSSTPDEPAFVDLSYSQENKRIRDNGGISSLCKKRSQVYKELMTRPRAHIETYLFLSAYNKFIDIVADRIKMPSLKLLKNDLTPLEEYATDYNSLICFTVEQIDGTVPPEITAPYVLTAAERRKFLDFFKELPRITFKRQKYKPELVEQVKERISSLGIFSLYPTNLIMMLSNGGENDE